MASWFERSWMVNHFFKLILAVNIPISGYYLAANGWQKKGFEWRKGNDIVTYDGCDWRLNGIKIEFTNLLP